MPTQRELRRSIGQFRWQGRKLMELFGTATGATTTSLDLGELNPYPAEANYFDMYGLSAVGGAGAAQDRVVTAFTQGSNRLVFAPSYTTFDTTTIAELWKPGLNATIVNDAIAEAIDDIAEDHLEEWSSILMGTEDGRVEYGIPSAPRFIYGVQLFSSDPLQGISQSTLNTYRGLSNISAAQQLAQTFLVRSDDSMVRGVLLYLRIQGTISTARTITCAIQTTTAGAPSGTQVTGATATVSTDDVGTRGGYYFFDFGRPVELDNATYALVVSTTGGVDATNYTQWGEDTDNGYADGSLYRYDGATWTAVSGSDMCMQIVSWGQDWIDLLGHEWDITRETANAYITLLGDAGKPLPTDFAPGTDTWGEGRPIRLLGYSTSDRPSDDTSNIDAPRAYVQAKALAIVLRSLPNPVGGDLLQWIQYYEAIAEKERKEYPIRTFLHPNSRRVRTSGG